MFVIKFRNVKNQTGEVGKFKSRKDAKRVRDNMQRLEVMFGNKRWYYIEPIKKGDK